MIQKARGQLASFEQYLEYRGNPKLGPTLRSSPESLDYDNATVTATKCHSQPTLTCVPLNPSATQCFCLGGFSKQVTISRAICSKATTRE